VEEEQGITQCMVCLSWFKRAGGLAAHRRVHGAAVQVPNLVPS